MFRPASLRINDHYRKLKNRSQRYIKNSEEPKDKPSHDLPLQNEQVLVENTPLMKNRFRHIAQRLRVIKEYGIKDKNRNNDE